MGLFKVSSDVIDDAQDGPWKCTHTIPSGLRPTAAAFPAVPTGIGANHSAGTWGSTGIVSDGDCIRVPGGYGLVLMEEGGVTGFVSDPGYYVWDSAAPDWDLDFAETSKRHVDRETLWERFRFVGLPQAKQQAYFVSLRELPNNRFGTGSDVHWCDEQLKVQVGARVRGSYTLRIAEPVVFIRGWISPEFIQQGTTIDFTDPSNTAFRQLFHEVVGGLGEALSVHTIDQPSGPQGAGRQHGTSGFARSLSEVMERTYQWRSSRGIEIVSASIVGLEYNEVSRQLLKKTKPANALRGVQESSNRHTAATLSEGDLVEKLGRYKQLLEDGLITKADYNSAKTKLLDL